MTTWTAATDTFPTVKPRPALLAILGARIKRSRVITATLLATIARLILTLTALTGLTVAAWHSWGMGAGLAVGSVACLVVEYVVKRDT